MQIASVGGFPEEQADFRVSIGDGQRKVYTIVLVLKFETEGKAVVGLVLLSGSFDSRVVVPNIGPTSVPSPLVDLVLFDWEDGYFHALLVEALFFDEVEDVDSDGASFPVSDPEEEPLVVSVSVGVVL